MNRTGKTILLVEDEQDTITFIKEKLEEKELIVNTALNGEEGLEMALSLKPDIILLDIVMPKMDGITMLQELRNDPWGKLAKVIILTNLSDPDNFTKARCLNVSDYLVKTNWKLVDLVEVIESKLSD